MVTNADKTSEDESPHDQEEYEARVREAATTFVIRPDNDAREIPLNTTAPNTVTSREPQSQQKEKLGHRRIDEQGGVSYKKVPTNALMQAIQLGIANSIGSLASAPNRDVLLQDFEKVEMVSFPAAGSLTTPSHTFGDFRFRTYAPMAFRYFRNLFSIQTADFLKSICTQPLKELSNSGASGSIFYVSQDDQFIIKTVQHKEADFLQKLLPGYYMNLNQNPRTLLPKFFGLFCYQSLGKNIRLLVMNNLLPTAVTMHEKYDMKGSTYKRMANKAERAKSHPTLKDLDFIENHREGIFIDPVHLDALIKTISRDCLVLESFKIMDYSLLIGIHNVEMGIRARTELEDSNNQEIEMNGGGPTTSKGGGRVDKNGHKVLQEKLSFWDTGDSEVPHNGVPARNSNGDRLVLYLGIIDILQNYRLLKKMEHTWKAILHDGDTISVHNPNFYASRFLSFITEHVLRKGTADEKRSAKFRTLVHSYLALKQSPSRKRTTLKHGSSNEEDTTVISGPQLSQRVHKESGGEGGIGNFGSQTARESTRLYNNDKEDRVVSARDVHPIIPSGVGLNRATLRRSYREGGAGISMDKKEKKVERLFASSKPEEHEPLTEERSVEVEEIVSRGANGAGGDN